MMRQTGRTSRMIEHAETIARTGRDVTVVMGTTAQAASECKELFKQWQRQGVARDVKHSTAKNTCQLRYTEGVITFMGFKDAVRYSVIDLTRDPICADNVLVDHFAMESVSETLEAMATRYDLPGHTADATFTQPVQGEFGGYFVSPEVVADMMAPIKSKVDMVDPIIVHALADSPEDSSRDGDITTKFIATRPKDLYHRNAKLVRVVDADTIDLMVDGGFETFRKIRVRVVAAGYNLKTRAITNLAIDAPELSTPKGKDAALMIGGWFRLAESVTICTTKVDGDTDKYGRYLATIWNHNNVSLGNWMLAEKLAVVKNWR